ncbi:MAG: immunoglobulin domain-containing protein, partial [Limisphaerales bacterium]
HATPEPLTYQWRKNGTNIAQATASSFTLNNILASDAGIYSVMVGNNFGTTLSSNAVLRIGLSESFTNNAGIVIPINQMTAAPYPSTIQVSGITQTLVKVSVTLSSLTHSFPSDLDVLLVNPSGNAVYLLSEVGGSYSVTNVTLTFDDEADAGFDYYFPITPGTYRPTALDPAASSPSPAPMPPYATNLLALVPGDPNGPWSLYVSDGFPGSDSGGIAGWSLQFVIASNLPPEIIQSPTSRNVPAGQSVTFNVSVFGSAPLSYQWRKGGSNIAGATQSSYTIPSVTLADAGSYSVLISNPFGSALSEQAILGVISTVPLAEALDGPGLTWITGGHASWYGQTIVSFDSVDAAVSGEIGDSQHSWVETTVTGPGTLQFAWRVSSEQWFDWLEFHMNGTMVERISGERPWQQRTFYLESGTQQLRWSYTKDDSVSHSQDRGWLDTVTFVPGGVAPAFTEHPMSTHITEGAALFMSAEVQGTAPISFQWYKNGVMIPGATSSILYLPNIERADAGPYSIVASNPYGSNESTAYLAVSVSVFEDNFESGINLSIWQQFGGEVLATNYGGSMFGTNSLWFNGNGSRFAATGPLDVSGGGRVEFKLRLASGSAHPWELVDLPEKGVVLEYSLDGQTWVNLTTYNSSWYYYWSSLQVDIPAAACSPGTRFRWRQLAHSGSGQDHWALD